MELNMYRIFNGFFILEDSTETVAFLGQSG